MLGNFSGFCCFQNKLLQKILLGKLIYQSVKQFGKVISTLQGHYEEQFCKFISNLGQWFRKRCRLKDFLSGALVALLFSGAEPFMQL